MSDPHREGIGLSHRSATFNQGELLRSREKLMAAMILN